MVVHAVARKMAYDGLDLYPQCYLSSEESMLLNQVKPMGYFKEVGHQRVYGQAETKPYQQVW